MRNCRILLVKHWKSIGKILFAGLVLFLIIKGGGDQLEKVNFLSTVELLRQLPILQALLLLLIGIGATGTMTLYDFTIIRYFKHRMKRLLFFNIAFVANALNNLLGLGGLAGATARTILLRKNNLDLKASLYYNVLLAPATPTGLSILAVILLVESKTIGSITTHYPWIYIGIIGMIVYLPIYLVSDKLVDRFKLASGTEKIHKSLSLKIRLICISFIEWFSAALVFYYITSIYVEKADFIYILSVYSIAAIAGIISFLPGGIGSFDLIAFVGLQLFHIQPTDALAILVLFRVFYYFIPALIGVFGLLLNITMDRNEKLFSYSFFTNLGVLNNIQKYYKTYSDFVNVLLSILVFSSGIVLLASAVKPGIIERVKIISEVFSNLVLLFSQSASIVIGFLLLVLSVEVLYKVKRAYNMALYLLIAGGFFTFLKGLDFEEAIFLFIVLCLIKISKPSFYRYSIPVRLSKFVMASFVGLLSIVVYFEINEMLYFDFITQHLYPENLFGNYGDVLYHSIITYSIFILFLGLLYARKDRIENDPLYAKPEFEKLTKFLSNQKGNALTHLLYLGDKNLFWACKGEVVIPYTKFQDIFVVLGDPIGNTEMLGEAIQEFQDFLDKYGYEAVFYEVSDKNLTVYHDNGYYFFKLGEEAIIDLEKFHLSGAKKSALRYTINSFTKGGFTFEIIEPPFDQKLLGEFVDISTEWLGKRSEMGFSMGWHKEDYLQLSSIAVLRDSNSKVIAFVSLMPSYDGNVSVSTDLMRIRNEVPHGTMDFLILSLCAYFKEKGYKFFNLGMAPLSNVGHSPNSHISEKMARFAFQYGKFFYSFEGLRKYKEKYDPLWKPKYLAYPQLISLPATLMKISMLVSSKKG